MEVRSRREVPGEEPRPSSLSWLVALIVAFAGFAVWRFVPSSEALLDPDAEPRAVTPRGQLLPAEQAVVDLFEGASPSVVFIRNLSVVVPVRGLRLDPTLIQEGTGSGFIWDREGHVVTNYHVIHGARELQVTLADHSRWPARSVGFDVEKDIAVLKIDAPESALPPIPVGTSEDVKRGQTVFAIGNPFGLDQTLTAGLISGLDREMPARFAEEGRGQHWITGLIQTDAAINPGNSGGPLLDSAGRLIGMNTAIQSQKGENNGIGFAIPVDTINRIVTDILRYGQARRPGLGVRVMQDIVARQFNVEGVIISEVQAGSGAARAGLRDAEREGGGETLSAITADIIVGVNGKAVRTTEDLFRELDRHSAGDRVRLRVRRGRETLEVDVELSYLN